MPPFICNNVSCLEETSPCMRFFIVLLDRSLTPWVTIKLPLWHLIHKGLLWSFTPVYSVGWRAVQTLSKKLVWLAVKEALCSGSGVPWGQREKVTESRKGGRDVARERESTPWGFVRWSVALCSCLSFYCVRRHMNFFQRAVWRNQNSTIQVRKQNLKDPWVQ